MAIEYLLVSFLAKSLKFQQFSECGDIWQNHAKAFSHRNQPNE
jgi:hypothetical protein